jgi:hypothetical protein
MPANFQPIFGLTAQTGRASITAVNNTRDLSTYTNAQLVFTGGPFGSRLERITASHVSADAGSASGTGIFRIYTSTSSSAGTNAALYKEIAYTTTSASATVLGTTLQFTIPGGLFIPSGTYVHVALTVLTGGSFQVLAEGYDY